MSFKNIVAFGFASILLLNGCTAKKDKIDPLTVDRPAEEIFKEATEADKNGEFTKAITLFSEVERQHPYSDLATQAQIRQAEVAYDNLKYDEAILSLDRFIELHPGHPNVDYAYYIKALCYLSLIHI